MTATPEMRSATIEDIENLPEGQHAELIDGVIYMQAPPMRIHQRLTGHGWLNSELQCGKRRV